jgi:phasin family protein
MQNEILNKMAKVNEANLESVKRLGEINVRVMERLTEQQFDVVSECLAGGMKQLETIGSTKDFGAAVATQTRMVQDLGEQMMGHVKKTADIMADVRNELTEWATEATNVAQANPFVAAKSKKAA